VKWFRGGPASSLIDKFKAQRSSKIEILNQLKYHVDIEKEKVWEQDEKQFVEEPMLTLSVLRLLLLLDMKSSIDLQEQDAVLTPALGNSAAPLGDGVYEKIGVLLCSVRI
jgi:hypothetical protein